MRYGQTKVVPRELSTLFVLSRGWRAFFYGKDLAVIQDMVEKKGERVMAAHCPECEAEVTVEGLMVGEVTFCPDCSAELEVINVEQPEVALAPEVEEDWGE